MITLSQVFLCPPVGLAKDILNLKSLPECPLLEDLGRKVLLGYLGRVQIGLKVEFWIFGFLLSVIKDIVDFVVVFGVCCIVLVAFEAGVIDFGLLGFGLIVFEDILGLVVLIVLLPSLSFAFTVGLNDLALGLLVFADI